MDIYICAACGKEIGSEMVFKLRIFMSTIDTGCL